MADNVFGMDIRRFSVLVLAVVVLFALFDAFATLPSVQVPQYGFNVTQSKPLLVYDVLVHYTYNKTIVLAPSLSDLAYVRAGPASTPPPTYDYYGYPVFFNFSRADTNALSLLLALLSSNASEVTPEAYGALLSIASSAYVKVVKYANATLFPMPLNPADTEDYSKWELIVKYAEEVQPPPGFQPGWSYPPSDLVTAGPLNVQVVNTSTVNAYVEVYYGYNKYITNTQVYQFYDVTWVLNYWAMDVWGDAILYVNGKPVASSGFYVTFPYYGGSYYRTLSGTYYINGSPIPVNGYYDVYARYGSSLNVYQVGNNSWVYCLNFYPVGPYVKSSNYTLVFYEYSVTLPITVTVFNGTDPVTTVGGETFTGRAIDYVVHFTTWSFDTPSNVTVPIFTRDSIEVANYTVTRTWDAGTVSLDSTRSILQNGNTTYYRLDFNVVDNTTRPPPWIFEDMTYNEYATVAWYYLEQNASLAHALYTYIMNTINKSDLPFWRFEYFALASQFVANKFPDVYSQFNNALELMSFYLNWSVVPATVYNISSARYTDYYLLFFNVSQIPPIYNASAFVNVTGDYGVYYYDVVNSLAFDNVSFGNPPTLVNATRTINLYYSVDGRAIPYVGEPLYFFGVNYVPTIYYAVTAYSGGRFVNVTAVWNGTAWSY